MDGSQTGVLVDRITAALQPLGFIAWHAYNSVDIGQRQAKLLVPNQHHQRLIDGQGQWQTQHEPRAGAGPSS